jgi:hypothetical protein
VYELETAICSFSKQLTDDARNGGSSQCFSDESRRGYFDSVSCTIRIDTATTSRAKSSVNGYGIGNSNDVVVSFWLQSGFTAVHSVIIPVPSSWTARLYAIALKSTITKRDLVIISPDDVLSSICKTVNEVHWLYHYTVEEVTRILEEEGYCFLLVNGGGG